MRPEAEPDELCWASIEQLGGLLRARAVTSVAVTERLLERLERTEPRLHAYVGLMADSALRDAAAADAAFARGQVTGSLQSVPLGVKNLCAAAGFPTCPGSVVLASHMPDEDAAVVRRLRPAGAVLVGKTVTQSSPTASTCGYP